jgi:bifunctional UDP-N-acetylglucosamine pyrophosphorylase/glucosamine-1-phosphate N-acetyltransferase
MTDPSPAAPHQPVAAIVLAAGKGTRMKSALPKAMHRIAGRPMVRHVLATLDAVAPQQVAVVVGPDMADVAQAVAQSHPGAQTAIQHDRRGTGDAVKAARGVLEGPDGQGFGGTVLVLYGDTPLTEAATLRRMVAAREAGAAVVVLGFRPDDPAAYGRLIGDADGTLHRIVEAKDATPDELANNLCNSGVMAIDGAHLFRLLDQIQPNNAKGEYYLTDIVGLATAEGLSARIVEGTAAEALGVNSRAELAEAEAILQDRLRARAMAEGATLIDPKTVWFSHDTRLGRDVVVHPDVVFGPGVTVGNGVEIRAFCHIEGAAVGAGAIVGPYARLRPGADIGAAAHIGNFVEVKNAVIGAGAKANHLSYIGDADVGAGSNIGAGTITCNYDGFDKHRTVIGEGAFIGSNSSLVAPVTVGAGAIVGAGSTIGGAVAEDSLVVERAGRLDKPGWAKAFRQRKQDRKKAG